MLVCVLLKNPKILKMPNYKIILQTLKNVTNDIDSNDYNVALQKLKDVGDKTNDIAIKRLAGRISKSIFGDLGYTRESTNSSSSK